nr:putative ribonuclease H-like domain-containing protein [Tanacetum cinerariifolium]
MVAGGEPPLTAAGPPLTTTGPPVIGDSAKSLVKPLNKVSLIVSLDLSKEVIEFGDSYKAPPEETAKDKALAGKVSSSTKKKGRTVAITAEDMQKRKNDAKERTTLLLALLDEHQLRFSKYDFAKELWEAISKTFAIVSNLEFMDVPIEKDDLNQKFLTSLATDWLVYTIVQRNKDDLDTISLDDVYNNLKVYKPENALIAIRWVILLESADHQGVKTEGSERATRRFQMWKSLLLRPAPSIDLSKVVSKEQEERWKSNNPFFFEQGGSSEHSNEKRPFEQKSADKNKIWSPTVRPKIPTVGSKFPTAKPTVAADKGNKGKAVKASARYWDSGCSRHMTGNISYLFEYEPFNGGYVSFTHGRGKITDKGSIKTGKLEFENVYFVEELKYNLFRVSQIWDNKNSVLFTDTECLMLGKDFKLVDDKHVFLRTPTRQNMYTINLKNVDPHKNLTCLIAKALVDESMLLHRRKRIKREISNARTQQNGVAERRNMTLIEAARTMLPDAKLPGKQHKASCKSKLVNSVSKPIHTFHMDSFGPTSISSLNHKWTHRQHNMYSIDLNNIVPYKNLTCLVAKASVDESMLWHRRLGHLNFKTMNKLVRNSLVKGLPSKCFENDHTCVACLKGKQHKASCKTKLVNSSSKPFHTLHMDLFGPTSVSSLNHKWYCLVVTDDFSRFTWTFFLRTKDETSSILRNFIIEIENLKDLKVKIIMCDNEGEFKNKEMNEFCTKKGIRRELSNARTPQQNRVAERRNKTLTEAARTMLADAKLPVTFWAKAVNTACYVQNRVLVNKSQNKTPYELFNSRIPDIGFLSPFGCHVMILNTLDHLRKFDAKGDEGTKDVTSQAVKKDVSSLRYIALPNWFHESHMETSNDTIRNNDEQDDSQKEQDCNANVLESSRISNPTATSKVPSADQVEPAVSLTVEYDILIVSLPVPTICLDISPDSSSVTLNEVEADLSNMETSIPVSPTPTFRIHKDHPKSQIIGPVDTPVQTRHNFLSYEERKKIFDALKDLSWVEAMQEEILQFKIQNVWVLVDCPKGMDVKSTFLYGTIDEEVYVMQPPGFEDPEFPERVYKVEKAMYGLHQAPRAWYVLQKKDGIFLSQDKYVGDILKKFRYSDVRSMIESLMYLTASRPDIMFAIYACARHQVTPKECHLHAFKRIFRYLKGHPKLGLWYPKESPFDLVAYSDNDYGGATQDRKSTARDSASGYGQVLWIQNQMLDYGYNFMNTKIDIDNNSAICIVKNLVYHSKTKHIEIRYHFTRDCYEKKLITVNHIHIDENVADLLTKPFDVGRFQYLVLAFCDYHNMVTILEKTEHNTDFHQIVDFLEASHIRIETTDQETKIIATVDGKPRTISESSLRRHLKLNDEEWISSLPDAELFENLSLMGYNILPNQSNIATAVVCLATNRVYNFSKITFDGMVGNINSKGTKFLIKVFTTLRVNNPIFSGQTVLLFASMIITLGEGSTSPTEPHHTPSPQEHHLPQHDSPPPSHQTITFEPISQAPTETLTPRRYTRRAIRIAQSKALLPIADEPASLSRDDRQVEAFPNVSSLDAGQDRENIAKTSALPHESSPKMAAKIKDQDLEISGLKARVNFLEDKERSHTEPTQEDAPITGGIIDIGEELGAEKSTEKGSSDTEEMINVLSSMEATNILSSGGAAVSVSPADVLPTTGVPTVSGSFPTVSAIFTTASVVTPYTRRSRGITIESSQPMRIPIIRAKDKGKEKVIEAEVPKKRKLQEQIDAQVAREMEEEFARENQKLSEQLARDSEIARIHAEEELKIMIEGLDRSNEVIAKHLSEYEQAEADLSSKPLSKKEQREFYMSVLRSHVGWKTKHFKEESERVKRQGLKIDQGSSKRMKISKGVSEGVSKEELKGMMQIVPLEEVELKRPFEPEFEDQLWTHHQAFARDPLDWKLYDTCGVHHVSTKDQEIFMLVEKDYPLRKGLATMMISNKLQVEQYSQMASDLILKIHGIANSPR